MRNFSLCILLAFIALGKVSAQGTPQTKPAKDDANIKVEVLKLEQEREQALLRNDADWFERVFADDIDYNGGTLTKQQIVEEIRSRQRTWQAVRHDEYRVRVYGNTAVVTYRSGSTMVYKGKVATTLAHTTDVYVKQSGVWRAVVHHVTPIAKQ